MSFTKCLLPHAGSVLQLQGAQIAPYYCDTLNEQGHLAVCLTRFPGVLVKLVLMVATYSTWAEGRVCPSWPDVFRGTSVGLLQEGWASPLGWATSSSLRLPGSTAVCSWGLQGFPAHPKPLLMWLQEKLPQPMYGTSAFLLAYSHACVIGKKSTSRFEKSSNLVKHSVSSRLATVHAWSAPPRTMWWCLIWFSWKVVESLRGGR